MYCIRKIGSKRFAAGKWMSNLEQCIIMWMSMKIGMTDEQPGFVFDCTQSVIYRIKMLGFQNEEMLVKN